MIFNTETAKTTAELLLKIRAIKLQPKEPFTWASGWKSPIYCDNRIIMSYPSIRNYVKEKMANYIVKEYGKPDIIAGVATGAISIGMLVADHLGLPFIYVRPEPKTHGRKNQIEGILREGQNVMVIEDLISTGNSSLNAVEALNETGVNVKGVLAVFTYGFQVSKDNFKNNKVKLHTLSDYDTLLEEAVKINYIKQSDLTTLADWNKSPSNWKAN